MRKHHTARRPSVRKHLPTWAFIIEWHGEQGRNPVICTLRARRLCFANGHDVDSVDVFRLMLHTRLDATHQCLDLTTAQAIVG